MINTGNQLGKNDELYRDLFYHMNEASAICEIILDQNGEPYDYRLLDVNSSFEKIFGLPADQIRGKTRKEFGGDDSFWLELFGKVVKTGDPEIRMDYSSRFEKWFDLRAFSLGGDKFACIFTDATEKQYAEEALDRSNRHIEEILASIQDGFFTLDRDWQFVYVNERAAGNLGLKPDQLVGRTIWEMYPQILGTPYELNYRRAMDTRQAQQFESQSVLVNQYYCITVYPLENGISVYWQNITERKKAEEELREKEHRLATAQEVAQLGVWEYDVAAALTHYDRRCGEVFGISTEEPLSNDIVFALIHPEDRKRVEDDMDLGLRIGRYETEYRIVRVDGSQRWVIVRGFGILSNEGKDKFIRFVGTLMDITERKQAEEALRLSEEKFSAAFHWTLAGMVISRLHDGLIIDVNNSWLELFGYSREKVIGKPMGLQVWKSSVERSRMVQELEQQGFLHNREVQFHRSNGDEWTAIVSAQFVTLNGERVLIASAFDITTRKKVEEELRLSEEKFSAAFHGTLAGMSISRLHDGLIIDVNDRWLELFGFGREEVIGKRISQPWKDPVERSRIVRDLEQQGFFHNREVQFLRVNGEEWTAITSGYVTTLKGEAVIIGSLIDITTRKRSEEELRESEQRFSTMFYSSPAALCITKLSNGCILDVNESYQKLFGYTREELIGHTTTELGMFETYNGSRDELLALFKKNGYLHNVEMSYRTKTGKIIWTIFSTEAINIQGQPFIITTLFDITERKQAEEKIIQLNKDLKKRVDELQTLFDVIPISICISEDPDCKTMLSNKVFTELLDIVAGANMSQSAPEGERPDFKAYHNGRELLPEELPLQRAAVTGKTIYGSEFDIVRADGRIISLYGHAAPLFDEVGRVRGAIGGFDDITERKRLEEKLQETVRLTEQRANELETIISSIAAGVIIYDSLGNIVKLNESASKLLEYSRADYNTPLEERRGRLSLCKKDGKPYEKGETPLERALHGETIRNEEMNVTLKSNKKLWLSCTLVPIVCSSMDLIGEHFKAIGISDNPPRQSYRAVSTILWDTYINRFTGNIEDIEYPLQWFSDGFILGTSGDPGRRLVDEHDPPIPVNGDNPFSQGI